MDLNDFEVRRRVARYLGECSNREPPEVTGASRLAGGTLQDNWRLDIRWSAGDQPRSYVLRTAGASGIQGSVTRVQEYAILKNVADAGVTVATPRWVCEDERVAGSQFLVTDFVQGTTSPQRIIKEAAAGGWGPELALRLGQELARLHRVASNPSMAFLPAPERGTGPGMVADFRAYLDTLAEPHPTLEWILRWLEVNAPDERPHVLCHGDFRTGNYMVHEGALCAILDWELAHWGQPYEDMGWLCARFWRFGAPDRAAGGLADRAALFDGYESGGGRRPAAGEAHYWEVMANARWAIISLQQVQRHLSGQQPSLELALIGRQTCEMELEALNLIERGHVE